ncbi:hypothetical protein [Spirochaeta lutea]|uniref:Uncharacterized protein n=1 Tax=Spirochaeta lutea TaxID=1480694 RepID=A0A098R0G4_9SPIO|nr:hypothetical protein [Spirochaeta lutea]KGE72212.1 hypothetical protein DC28_07455 [Spirochaeta lutea]
MRWMIGFELYRLRKQHALWAYPLFSLMIFVVYGFSLHLSGLGVPPDIPLVLNTSYAAYALIAPVPISVVVSCLFLAGSFLEDQRSGCIQLILTRGLNRREYFWGRVCFYLLLHGVVVGIISGASWGIANVVFENRFPISANDIEVLAPGVLGPYLLALGGMYLSSLIPLVLIGLAGYFSWNMVILVCLAAGFWFGLNSVSADILGSALLPDYQFTQTLDGFRASAMAQLLPLGSLVFLGLLVPVINKLLYRKDF